MSQSIRFHVDEHIATMIVRALRRHGIDVTTPKETGLLAARDDQHLFYAYDASRVVVTQDQDFLRLHAAGHSHAGIVFFPQGRTAENIVQQLILLHAVLSADDMAGRVEYL